MKGSLGKTGVKEVSEFMKVGWLGGREKAVRMRSAVGKDRGNWVRMGDRARGEAWRGTAGAEEGVQGQQMAGRVGKTGAGWVVERSAWSDQLLRPQ